MNRAASPVLGTLLLTVVAVVVAGAAGVVATAFVPSPDPGQPVELSASVNATSGRIVLVHESGPALDVREIDVRVAIDGTPLRYQPSVPFYSETGFASFPSGPFNPVTDPGWDVGERASLVLTDANEEPLVRGASVRIELYRDDLPIARAQTVAR